MSDELEDVPSTGVTASEDDLSDLHRMMTKAMRDKLKSGLATASDLSVIRQFLKDNGINADGKRSTEIKSLADDLPELDDNVTPLYGR